MDRGWGLTLDNSDKVGFFGNKPVFGANLTSPRLDHRSSGNLIMFPVSSRGREELSSPPLAEHRLALGEVDFFAEKKRPAVKKEDSSHAEASAGRELDVNVSCCI